MNHEYPFRVEFFDNGDWKQTGFRHLRGAVDFLRYSERVKPSVHGKDPTLYVKRHGGDRLNAFRSVLLGVERVNRTPVFSTDDASEKPKIRGTAAA